MFFFYQEAFNIGEREQDVLGRELASLGIEFAPHTKYKRANTCQYTCINLNFKPVNLILGKHFE